ncbi:MAG: hypothetical protein LC650_01320, partial [Actinobacteria bacterium]|nr:hypothetical protein [Actinomycetota bacterium]
MAKSASRAYGPVAGGLLEVGADREEEETEESHGRKRHVPFARDEIDIDQRQMQECEYLWRNCVYVQRASQRLNQVTLAGSLEILLGGLFPVPSFDRAVADRILRNLKRAMQWIDVVGMVPFSVDHVNMAVGASHVGFGGEVGLRSDDPDIGGQRQGRATDELRPSGMARVYRKRPGSGSGYTLVEELGEGTNGEGDTPPSEPSPSTGDAREPVEASDFDFTVPSLGVGYFTVYRDARDNIRKAVYHSPEDNKQTDATGAQLPKRNWYVFTVDTPSVDGKLSSILSRLLPAYKELRALERLELDGARLGFHPQLVTEQHPPGKNQRQIDRHAAFATDGENMAQIGKKNRQGIDPFYMAALERNTNFHRELLKQYNIDYDEATHRFRQNAGDDPSHNQQRIPKGSTLSSVLVPHKVMDIQAHHNTYVGKVAIEYGISHTDFAAGTMRFKLDQGTVNAQLIERARSRRTVLSGLLHDVFVTRNGSRLRTHLTKTLDEYTEKASVVNVARQKMEALIKESSKQALSHVPEGVPGEYIRPPPQVSAPAPTDASPSKPAAPKNPAGPNDGAASMAGSPTPSPDLVTPGEVLPESLQKMMR